MIGRCDKSPHPFTPILNYLQNEQNDGWGNREKNLLILRIPHIPSKILSERFYCFPYRLSRILRKKSIEK